MPPQAALASMFTKRLVSTPAAATTCRLTCLLTLKERTAGLLIRQLEVLWQLPRTLSCASIFAPCKHIHIAWVQAGIGKCTEQQRKISTVCCRDRLQTG